MRIIATLFGCLSYAAGAVLLLVDALLYAVHRGLRTSGDRFVRDGDYLTGWGVNG